MIYDLKARLWDQHPMKDHSFTFRHISNCDRNESSSLDCTFQHWIIWYETDFFLFLHLLIVLHFVIFFFIHDVSMRKACFQLFTLRHEWRRICLDQRIRLDNHWTNINFISLSVNLFKISFSSLDMWSDNILEKVFFIRFLSIFDYLFNM